VHDVLVISGYVFHISIDIATHVSFAKA